MIAATSSGILPCEANCLRLSEGLVAIGSIVGVDGVEGFGDGSGAGGGRSMNGSGWGSAGVPRTCLRLHNRQTLERVDSNKSSVSR